MAEMMDTKKGIEQIIFDPNISRTFSFKALGRKISHLLTPVVSLIFLRSTREYKRNSFTKSKFFKLRGDHHETVKDLRKNDLK